jgi:hypothetical protein
MRVTAVMVIVVALALLAGCPPKVESPPPTTATAPPAAKAPASPPPAGGNAQAEEAAVAAADAWLKLVDEGKYDGSWAQTAALFRKAVTQADWAKQMKTFREPLGELVSRKVQSKQYATTLPGAPDGEYVVIQYETSYAKKKSAIETVTPLKDADGSWRVSGYFIK